jgi:hypothetical protein
MLGVILMPGNLSWNERAMKMVPRFETRFRTVWLGLILASLLSLVLFLSSSSLQPMFAQTGHGKTNALSEIQQELIRTEIGFFEAWKSNDAAYFRSHMPEDAIFWGESGAFSRDQQLQQQSGAKACNVEGYGLSDFGVLPLTSGAYLLTYKGDQYATCSGERLPIHINGSSIYVLKSGHWQAVYRAEVPNIVPRTNS